MMKVSVHVIMVFSLCISIYLVIVRKKVVWKTLTKVFDQ